MTRSLHLGRGNRPYADFWVRVVCAELENNDYDIAIITTSMLFLFLKRVGWYFVQNWGRFTFFGCIFWRRWSLQQSPMWMLHSFEDRHSSPGHIYIYNDIHLTNIPKIVTPFIISHVLYPKCNISPPKRNFVTFPLKIAKLVIIFANNTVFFFFQRFSLQR